jgi:hypothetical protein
MCLEYLLNGARRQIELSTETSERARFNDDYFSPCDIGVKFFCFIRTRR